MRCIYTILILIHTATVYANIDSTKNYATANKLLIKQEFTEALRLLIPLAHTNADNANLNFKIGLCYYKLPGQKSVAQPYFSKAIQQTTADYDFKNLKETAAPVDAYFFLGDAFLAADEPDSAMTYLVHYLNLFEDIPPLPVNEYLTKCINRKNGIDENTESEEDLSVYEKDVGITAVEEDVYTAEIEKEVEKLSAMPPADAVKAMEGLEGQKALDVMAGMELEKAVDILDEMSTEKAVGFIESMPVEKATGLVEGMEMEKSVGLFEEVGVEKAAELMNNMSLEKSVAIVNELEAKVASDVMGAVEVEKAVDITNGVEIEKAIDLVVNLEAEKAGEVLSLMDGGKATKVVSGLQKNLDDLEGDEKSSVVNIIKEYFAGQISSKKVTIFKTIYFDFNSSELLLLSKNELMVLVDFLYENPKVKIEVVGHTDNIGDWDANLKVSGSRASVVYDFLRDNKISKERIIFYGKGSASPIADNYTDFGRKINRRVEVILLQ